MRVCVSHLRKQVCLPYHKSAADISVIYTRACDITITYTLEGSVSISTCNCHFPIQLTAI